MTRLIDADAFKKILSEHEMNHDKRRSFNDYDCGAANAYEYANDLLDEMPTVEERPHGEWLSTNPNDKLEIEMKCSLCGIVEYPLCRWNFCPNCGADMRKSGEEE